MADNTTLINEVAEDVVEATAPAVADTVGKTVAEYKITTADKVMASGIIGLAVVGLGSIGYFGYKGGKALYKKIKAKAAEIKAQQESVQEVPEAVEVVEEEPKKETKKAATK